MRYREISRTDQKIGQEQFGTLDIARYQFATMEGLDSRAYRSTLVEFQMWWSCEESGKLRYVWRSVR